MTSKPSLPIKRLVLPLMLLGGLILFFASGLHHFISFQSLAAHYGEIKAFIKANQWQAYGLYFLIYLVAVAFSLPIAGLLTLSGGALFGLPAALIIILAASIGASIVFLATQSILADTLSRKAGPFLKKLEIGFTKNAFSYLLALRLVPLVPFWVLNIAPALLGMRLVPFFIATFIGIIPSTIIFVSVASGFDHILQQGQTPDLGDLSDIRIIGPLIALGALSLLGPLVKAIRAKSKEAS